ncbi:hypothetical protein FB465_6927 [Kitasatospora atroaurantiaca]|uniref:Uncharacterized protein n=1 Tax=Kitasatospora atroaurantiaca TaxID=285545 RepID=A0A561F1L8_9ACTN|nr:hypothetical protein FB465_6927 [Kitasatospora atroaurantiaca]
MADVSRAAGALYDVTNVLCASLFADLDTGQPGSAAEDVWDALLAIARAWQDAPGMPDDLRKLILDAALREPEREAGRSGRQ